MNGLERNGFRMWRLLIITAFAFSLASSFPMPAMADDDEDEKPPADFIMKDTGKDDYVMFSHTKKHQEKVKQCVTCHPKIFSSKLGRTKETKGELKMAAMEKGEFCGKCHNGTDSFDVKSLGDNKENCLKCHSVKK
jgi:c(7)-type cytochrome triheme protein